MASRFDSLDEIAIRLAKGDTQGFGALSTGERLYVALAANSAEHLDGDGYTVVEAFARLGEDWSQELLSRWRHRGNPQKW